MMLFTACSPEADYHESKATITKTNKDTIIQPEIDTPKIKIKPNVSQQFVGDDDIQQRLAKALPEIPYTLEHLTDYAQKVNAQIWENNPNNKRLTPEQIIKIQALLNWNHHKVGAIDGIFNQNTIKAMNTFQYKHKLPLTTYMNAQTWDALTQDHQLLERPVLINYVLTKDDVNLSAYAKKTAYRTVREAIAERFQMNRELLMRLNPHSSFKAGEMIIVYNPAQPNEQAITKLIADKKKNILFAFNAQDELIASYPTTVGAKHSPSPVGTYRVVNRYIDPSYNRDFKNKANTIPAGPNNPVGRVWLGLNKRSFGIHGSPEPEMISRQVSSGCVRLTNWDALSLFGTIQDNAVVEFVEKDYMQTQLVAKEKQRLEQLKQEIEKRNHQSETLARDHEYKK